MDSHLNALANKHADLEDKIVHETRRPAPDSALIATLKKQKLKLKEAMRLHQ